ncbi:lactate utilization protein [bacterium]|nr:lactate utilization protein [bacterium]
MSAPATRDFRRRSTAALADAELHANLRRATGQTLAKRRALLAELPGADADREAIAAIRAQSHAAREALLAQAKVQLAAAGFTVHEAADAAAARALVLALLEAAGARRVVKSKSMITEEIDLNTALADAGIEVVETDLGEFIVQQLGQRPSHITAPALHLNRRQIGALFAERGLGPASEDPEALTAQARVHLRAKFLAAEAGITGANFVVAETGTLVLLENEGNIGLSSSLPPLHIAIAGIEKVLPRLADLDPLLRLLPLNATGQRAGSYTSLINGPAPAGDGPTARHVIFLDGGRRALAASPEAEILACLRCGSCLNVCPCFRHAGGHAYGGVYPGPLGILLAPYLGGAPAPAGGASAHGPATSLADVCALCDACAEICPAEIPLPTLIWKARTAREAASGAGSARPWRLFAALTARPRAWRFAGALLRLALKPPLRGLTARLAPTWNAERALPAAPARSFAAELARRHPGRLA